MAGVKLSLLWSMDGCDEKLYPRWGQAKPHRPPRIKKEIPQPKIIEVEPTEISVLKYQIKVRKESLEATRVYARKLFSQNIALMDKIMKMEDKTHSSTGQILDRYEHYKGAIAKLKLKSAESLTEARKDLEGVRVSTDLEIATLRDKARKIVSQIDQCSRQLQIMRHYKDNEFPVRVAKIEQMNDKLADEQVHQEVKIVSLQKNIVEKTLEDVELQSERDEAKTIENATKAYLETTKKSVEAKAIQNELMLREISMHHEEKDVLIQDIDRLKSAIAQIRSSLRRQEFIKCLPDSEITLDIPVLEPLPA